MYMEMSLIFFHLEGCAPENREEVLRHIRYVRLKGRLTVQEFLLNLSISDSNGCVLCEEWALPLPLVFNLPFSQSSLIYPDLENRLILSEATL